MITPDQPIESISTPVKNELPTQPEDSNPSNENLPIPSSPLDFYIYMKTHTCRNYYPNHNDQQFINTLVEEYNHLTKSDKDKVGLEFKSRLSDSSKYFPVSGPVPPSYLFTDIDEIPEQKKPTKTKKITEKKPPKEKKEKKAKKEKKEKEEKKRGRPLGSRTKKVSTQEISPGPSLINTDQINSTVISLLKEMTQRALIDQMNNKPELKHIKKNILFDQVHRVISNPNCHLALLSNNVLSNLCQWLNPIQGELVPDFEIQRKIL